MCQAAPVLTGEGSRVSAPQGILERMVGTTEYRGSFAPVARARITNRRDAAYGATRGRVRPLVLMILDGYGISFQQEGNAVLAANMVNVSRYLREYPSAILKASGIEVGLPWGEAGNSETGHRNMGAGRIMYQPLPQMTLAIRDKSFFHNPGLLEATNHVRERPDAALHIMGCVSTGGVHGHVDHLIALLELSKRQGINERTFVQAFLDGEDSPPRSAATYLAAVDAAIRRFRTGPIATMIGRYYAMARSTNWDRTETAYNLLVHGKGQLVRSWKEGLAAAYEQQKTDDVVPPMVIGHSVEQFRAIRDGDAIIFFNYRPDRARQLTYAFVNKHFTEFPVAQMEDLDFITMAEYEKNLPVTVAFPEPYAEFPVGRVISDAGLLQLRIAETEKYAHVTYFFNSGRELPYPGEDRVLIPSPKVRDFAATPAMSAVAITERVVSEIEKGKYDVIVMNYANSDLLAHTGNFQQTVTSLKLLDEYIGRVVPAALAAGGAVLLACDHGNAEEMTNPLTREATTEHSGNPVPIAYIAPDNRQDPPKSDDLLFQALSTPIGELADVGPTVLEILGLPKPAEMTSRSLLGRLM